MQSVTSIIANPLEDFHKKDFISKFHTYRDTFFAAENIAGHWRFEKYRKTKTNTAHLTHFTPNNFSWRARTHAADGLQYIAYLFLDIDLDRYIPDGDTRLEYLKMLSAKCAELAVKPTAIIRTRRGYHIAFKLSYPYSVSKSPKIHDMAGETLERLKLYLTADIQPGLHSFMRLPQAQTDIVHLDPFQTIIIAELLKKLSGKTNKVKDKVKLDIKKKIVQVKGEGYRNNTAYTLALLCKNYGRDMDYAKALVISLGGCETEREMMDTIRSAFKGRRKANNEWVQRLCLGASVSDAARRFGIYEPMPVSEIRARQRMAGIDSARKRILNQLAAEGIIL